MENLTKGEKTKLIIIKSAIKTFGEHGIDQTSFAMISRDSGLNTTAIFHHFRTKNILVMAMVKYMIDEMGQTLGSIFLPQDNAHESLKKYQQAHLNWIKKKPNEAKLILSIYYLASIEKDFEEINQMIYLNGVGRIERFLYAGLREKIFNIEEDNIALLANTLYQLLVGQLVLYASRAIKKNQLDSWTQTLDKLLNHK